MVSHDISDIIEVLLLKEIHFYEMNDIHEVGDELTTRRGCAHVILIALFPTPNTHPTFSSTITTPYTPLLPYPSYQEEHKGVFFANPS
jgi:hypothetical protein